ncbi:double-stranded RNA binding motif domain-containing protein [Aspergillus affinis]|uniref:double-stranded RNA binding motif domain-containing protein n=1 Tax=Aspergillus affinis TaxID=1070780 RepID=UPI0022FDBC26|nr:uncharacterized protein KD926_001465 [Aspergillus affinis]KAI9044235.1 hypothetical protein KD926_001465 [Aspergillus affinis]
MSAAAHSPGSPRLSWQEQLQEHCRRAKIGAPVFNIMSERRGGRTAWSSTVSINGQTIAARMWYDGQYINNAKEDVAEVALKHLNQTPSPHPTLYPGQLFPTQQTAPTFPRR